MGALPEPSPQSCPSSGVGCALQEPEGYSLRFLALLAGLGEFAAYGVFCLLRSTLAVVGIGLVAGGVAGGVTALTVAHGAEDDSDEADLSGLIKPYVHCDGSDPGRPRAAEN